LTTLDGSRQRKGLVRAPAPAGPSLLSASAKGKGERGDRRQRLTAWGHGVVKRLRQLGLDVTSSQADDDRIVFVPDGRLGLTLQAGAIEVAVDLPTRDLPVLRDLLADPLRALALTTALDALPEQFTLGVCNEAARRPAPRTASDDLRSLLDRAERGGGGLWLGWQLPREVAAAHATTLDGQLQDAAVALGQILKLVTGVAERPDTAPRRAKHKGSRRDDEPDRHGRRPRARARDHEPEVEEPEPEREREAAGDPASSHVNGRPTALRPLEARPRLRAGLARRRASGPGLAPGVGVERGVRVRVLAGPFAGKEGVVQDLDGNGGARVMLGLLAVRIDVSDLVSTEGGGRPRLSSSHRRPLPVRS
jgi:hypothetical protein